MSLRGNSPLPCSAATGVFRNTEVVLLLSSKKRSSSVPTEGGVVSLTPSHPGAVIILLKFLHRQLLGYFNDDLMSYIKLKIYFVVMMRFFKILGDGAHRSG